MPASFLIRCSSDTGGSTNSTGCGKVPQTYKLADASGRNPVCGRDGIPDVCKTLVIDSWWIGLNPCVSRAFAISIRNAELKILDMEMVMFIPKTKWDACLNQLSEVVEVGVNVVLTAHAQIRKFEQPVELGAYDRLGTETWKENIFPDIATG